MRAIHFSGFGLDIPGGVREVVRHLLRVQRKTGIDPVLVAFRERGGDYRIDDEIEQYWIARSRSTSLNWYRLGRLLKRVIRRSDQPTILNAHELRFSGLLGAKLKHKLNVPLVVTVHANPIRNPNPTRRSALSRLNARRSAARSADALVAVSKFVKDKIEMLVPQSQCPGQLREVAYSAAERIDTNQIARPDFVSGDYMLVLSRLARGKGLDWLIDAWARSRVCKRQWKLVIAGDGPLSDVLRRRSNDLHVSASVIFPGYLDGADKRSALAHCQAVVIPTYPLEEGLGLAALEAIGASKPLIAARSGGLRELIVENQTGLLVTGGDMNALANAITAIAFDQTMRMEFAANAGARRSAFSWSKTANEYRQCYDRLLS